MRFRAWYLASCCVVLLGALGCSSRITIGAVAASPADYENRDVTLSGTVTDQLKVPFLDRSLYRLQDDTGTIWVSGFGDAPKRNEARTVRGSVQTGVTIATHTSGVLLKEREPR